MAGPTRSIADMMVDARVLLQDTRSPFRYRENDLYTNLNSAMMQARRVRPDLFMGRFGKEDFGYDPSRSAEPFPLAPWLWEAFIEFIVGRAEMRDDEYSNDSRAVVFMNRFQAKLLSQGA
jgi:hypothetical protein